MHKEMFEELWSRTVSAVLYSIPAQDIKGKKQINEYLHRFVWEHTWGNEKQVPPERKLLNDMCKENPKKVMELESILSNVSVRNGWQFYTGISAAFAGIIMLIIVPGLWKVVAGILTIVGIAMMVLDVMQGDINPKKAALKALNNAKSKCDKIL